MEGRVEKGTYEFSDFSYIRTVRVSFYKKAIKYVRSGWCHGGPYQHQEFERCDVVFFFGRRNKLFKGICCHHLRGTSPTLTLILNLVYFNLLKYYKNKMLIPRGF